MKLKNNIVDYVQYLTISFLLDRHGNIYNKIKKTYYMSADFAGRHVVGFGDSSIDVFMEVQKERYS